MSNNNQANFFNQERHDRCLYKLTVALFDSLHMTAEFFTYASLLHLLATFMAYISLTEYMIEASLCTLDDVDLMHDKCFAFYLDSFLV